MNIEQQLAYLQKALEKGARIYVKFHGVEGEEEAAKLTNEFSELSGIPSESLSSEGTFWYTSEDYENPIGVTAFYRPFLEEDVNLTGSVEDAV